eukprot:s3900_g3.t1
MPHEGGVSLARSLAEISGLHGAFVTLLVRQGCWVIWFDLLQQSGSGRAVTSEILHRLPALQLVLLGTGHWFQPFVFSVIPLSSQRNHPIVYTKKSGAWVPNSYRGWDICWLHLEDMYE